MKPRPKPNSCSGCPAEKWGVGFVPPLIPREPTQVALIGQGPGELEARYSEPFLQTAPAGEMLTRWVHQANGQRSHCLISNVVWCWLPQRYEKGFPRGNRTPTTEEIDFCYERHLKPLLVEQGFSEPEKWIFAIGAPAAQHFLGEKKTEKYLGTANQKELP